MSGRDVSEAFARYAELVSETPALFTNPPGSEVRILLGEEDRLAAEASEAARLDAEGRPREWSRVGVVYEDEYVLLLRDAVAFPDGRLGTYIRFVRRSNEPAGVAVLPLRGESVLLLRHFRHATRRAHLEIPRGFWIDGLTAEKIARRELQEETGLQASAMTSLGLVHTNTGLSADTVELFVAKVDGAGRAETSEGIVELVPVEVAALERLIADGEISDSFTLAAYARARLRGIFRSYE